jgi:acyl-CoA thioester hydrolase
MPFPEPVPDMDPLPVTHEAVVLEEYRDEMDHMNVMWYAYLFAESTRQMFIELGLTNEYFLSNNSGSFMLECHTRYISEVRVGHRLELRTRILARTAKRLHAMHFMICLDDSRLAATLEIICAHVDMTTRRTSPFKESVALGIDAILGKHSALTWPAPVCGVMKA